MRYTLVHSAAFTKQLRILTARYSSVSTIWNAVDFGLRRDPFLYNPDENGIGVAITKPWGDAPALRIAFQISTKTVNLTAIEEKP